MSGVAIGVLLGGLLAAAFALQTAGLERTTVTSTGFVGILLAEPAAAATLRRLVRPGVRATA